MLDSKPVQTLVNKWSPAAIKRVVRTVPCMLVVVHSGGFSLGCRRSVN